MIKSIFLTLVVCGNLAFVVKWGKWNDGAKNLPATFAIVSFEEKNLVWCRFVKIYSPSMGSDGVPQTTCEDNLITVVRDVLTNSTHPP